MSARRDTPPRLAERLVRRAVRRRGAADAILGDLREEYAALREHGRGRADAWFWGQALAVAARYHFGLDASFDRDHGTRSGRGGRLLGDAAHDLRSALRSMRREPGFTTLVVVTLALGIGANAAMYGLVHRLLLSAPPYIDQPERVAPVLVEIRSGGGPSWTMSTTSYPTFADLRDSAGGFATVAAVSRREMVAGADESARRVRAGMVSGEYFELLGVAPLRGRLFGPAEDRLPTGEPVVVLDHGFWSRELGGADVLDTDFLLDDRSYTIVGITPPGFTGEEPSRVDVWVPLAAGMASAPPGWWIDRRRLDVSVLGRLAPGVSRQAAEAEASSILSAGETGAGDFDLVIRLGSVVPALGLEGTTGEGRIALWSAGVALLVLLIAVANVTNLYLVRGVRRHREVSLRLALGMGVGRLWRHLTSESLVLAAVAAGVAAVVAHWGGKLVRVTLLPDAPPAAHALEPVVLVAVFGTAALAGLLTGTLTAWQAGASAPVDGLRAGGPAASPARSPLRTSLVLVQATLSLVLLVGALLFAVSLHRVRTQDLGFAPARVLLARASVRDGADAAEVDAGYRRALAILERTGGVRQAVAVATIPFGPGMVPPISVPGMDKAPGEDVQLPALNPVEPGYFAAMDMRVLEGRGLEAEDEAASRLVVVVSESMAREVWPGETAVGKCIRFGHVPGVPSGPRASDSLPCRLVVGVVSDVRRRSIRPDVPGNMAYYVPFGQLPDNMAGDDPRIWGLIVRPTGDEPARLAATVGAALRDATDVFRHAEVQPLQALLEPLFRPWRLGAIVFGLLGGLALAIAGIGLFGALSYTTAQRTREMGIRLALGARSSGVFRLVMARALGVAMAGVVAGEVIALAAAPWVEPLLFETRPTDPWILAGAAAVLLLVAALAGGLPALRACRADPLTALQVD